MSSDSFKFGCPSCGQNISTNLESVGISAECPNCNSPLIVPEPHAQASSPEREAQTEFAPDQDVPGTKQGSRSWMWVVQSTLILMSLGATFIINNRGSENQKPYPRVAVGESTASNDGKPSSKTAEGRTDGKKTVDSPESPSRNILAPTAEVAAPKRREPLTPQNGVVGEWVAGGIKGMELLKGGMEVILEFTESGEFRWRRFMPDGTQGADGRKGNYTVSGSTITMTYDGVDFPPSPAEFKIKGRTLLLRSGPDGSKNFGEPYWDYFYFRRAALVEDSVSANSKDLQDTLENGIKISGNITSKTKDYKTFNSSGTFSLWTLDLVIGNDLPFSIDLGNTLIVAQISDEGDPVGSVRVRGSSSKDGGIKSPTRPHSCYMLDDFSSTDGGATARLAGASFIFDGSGEHSKYAGFGQISETSEYALFEELNPDTWIKDEAISGMVVIMPEFIIQNSNGVESFYVIVKMKRGLESGGQIAEWTVEATEFVPAKIDKLSEILKAKDSTNFEKILAVNWMALADTKHAPEILSSFFKGETEGQLLAACLNCYTQHGIPGIEALAESLEFNEESAPGIQLLASEYLDSRSHVREGIHSLSSYEDDESQKGYPSGEDRADFGGERLAAVPFKAKEAMILRRVIPKTGRASNAEISLYSDQGGKPGSKLADFVSTGKDFRGKLSLVPNQVVWIVMSSEKVPGWADPYWEKCPQSGVFGSCVISTDGGKIWTAASDAKTLKTTVVYTEM